MHEFLNREIRKKSKNYSNQRALYMALYDEGKLRLRYDSSDTRNASDTFNTRSGNCLSLVIMTAAFAKEMGLKTRYQQVFIEDEWSRAGELHFSSEHVNILIGQRKSTLLIDNSGTETMVVDFLQRGEAAHLRSIEIDENTVIAMFMNNRAAEALARKDYNQAYWWARAAIKADNQFSAAYNTLGVIYMRNNNAEPAYRALTAALSLNPKSLVTMSNMAQVLNNTDRVAEAKLLSQQLLDLQPHPPFHYFQLGLAAMNRNDYIEAKSLFKRELKRAPDYHEFHFWLGLAHFRLGEIADAEKELNLAKQNSSNQQDHALYAAKLNHLNATR
ncbi:tetratricopeptide repeat protein [Undibacterium sp.]|uniref:tetratricopeptide repeat protein n=1 Tax=Undibacterium sp. TaxID=1914977 RepID=UPI0037518480